MDPDQIDALARLVGTRQSRRAALSVLLGAVLLGRQPDVAAAKRHGKGMGKGKPKHPGHDARKQHGKSRAKRERQHTRNARAQAEATTGCCGTRDCPLPGPDARAAQCDFTGADLAGRDLSHGNLGQITGTKADFSGAFCRDASFGAACLREARFAGADLSQTQFGAACLFYADLTGATVDVARVLRTALLCGTTLPDGTISDRDCARGTACCPVCDESNHRCAPGEVCCDGQCVAGACCTNAQCPDPARPVCRDRICTPCTQNAECGADRICCDGTCVAGECCVNGVQSTCSAGQVCCEHACVSGVCCDAAGCAAEICQQRACIDHQCRYTPVFGEPGPACATFCCRDAGGAPDCCEAGTTTCTATGLCRCTSDQDCAATEICCAGSCEPQTWTNLTVFGEEGNGRGQFNRPTGVAIAGDEQTVWVVDQFNGRGSIWTKQANGSWANQTTFSQDGNGPDQLSLPFGIAVSEDGQTAWVGDQAHSRISVWAKQLNGLWAHVINFGSDGAGSSQLRFPTGVAVSGDGQTVWVADTGNNRISVWTVSGGIWSNQTAFGSQGPDPDQFTDPVGVTVSQDGQTAWVADRIATRISVWARQGNGSWAHVTNFGSFGSGPSQFRAPPSTGVSADGQTVWVADLGNNRISIWTRQANGDWDHQLNFGSSGAGPSQFGGPNGVAVSGDGLTVWVADVSNNRISIWGLGCPVT